MELTEQQLEYVAWRADPHREGDKHSWARDHGVSRSTIYKWESKPWFRNALEKRLAELNIEPDRIQAVLERLWREAEGGDVQAAKLYFAEIERIRPAPPKREDHTIAELSDEELEIAWREGLAALKARQ